MGLALVAAVAIVAIATVTIGGDGDDSANERAVGDASSSTAGTPGSGALPASGEATSDGEAATAESTGGQSYEGPDEPYRPPPGTEEAQAYETVTGVYEVVKHGKQADARTLCDLMTGEAQKEAQEYARQTSGIADQNCPRSVGIIVGAVKRYGNFDPTEKSEVIGLNVEGDRATASILFGNGRAQAVSLVKEDGEWKLGSALGATPGGSG